jgi:ADP-dependent NAD(P)H-hydrate dehydratase / NAD(P)H-hydrate epimerase
MSAPVISLAQMREWENATWATGQTEAVVIRRVGEIVARRALRFTRAGDLILIAAGKGHNGDDARCAIEHLADRRVEVLEVTEPATALPKLKALLAMRPALVIDGLFGIGLNRPLDANWIQFIRSINEAGVPVLSVDVPSGLNAETGEPFGDAIHASFTLTLSSPKQGLLQAVAWPFVGRLEVAPDIGLVPCPCASELQWTLADDFAGYPLPRPAASHKGTFGHLIIIAGSLGYHGAAVLAARGAQRAQPGLITLFTQDHAYHAVASQLQAVMVHPWKPQISLPDNASAVLIGPGLTASNLPNGMKTVASHLWRDARLPVIVDASALDWLPLGPIPTNVIRVITPHPGEAARLLKTTVSQVQSDRLGALRELSRRFNNCWVALKGWQTIVGRSSGEVFVNPSGNPFLAQGGSGDLLAGFLGGLLAQPLLQADPLKAIRYAVWQHGAAADFLQENQPNWVVEDLAATLGKVSARDA